ncbi:unnamed protein product, partial [Medioppia subpectinata]
ATSSEKSSDTTTTTAPDETSTESSTDGQTTTESDALTTDTTDASAKSTKAKLREPSKTSKTPKPIVQEEDQHEDEEEDSGPTSTTPTPPVKGGHKLKPAAQTKPKSPAKTRTSTTPAADEEEEEAEPIVQQSEDQSSQKPTQRPTFRPKPKSTTPSSEAEEQPMEQQKEDQTAQQPEGQSPEEQTPQEPEEPEQTAEDTESRDKPKPGAPDEQQQQQQPMDSTGDDEQQEPIQQQHVDQVPEEQLPLDQQQMSDGPRRPPQPSPDDVQQHIQQEPDDYPQQQQVPTDDHQTAGADRHRPPPAQYPIEQEEEQQQHQDVDSSNRPDDQFAQSVPERHMRPPHHHHQPSQPNGGGGDEPVSNSSYQCAQEGFFRDPNDCNAFFRCVNQLGLTRFDFRCGDGLHFDERYSVCNWPQQAYPPCGAPTGAQRQPQQQPPQPSQSQPQTPGADYNDSPFIEYSPQESQQVSGDSQALDRQQQPVKGEQTDSSGVDQDRPQFNPRPQSQQQDYDNSPQTDAVKTPQQQPSASQGVKSPTKSAPKPQSRPRPPPPSRGQTKGGQKTPSKPSEPMKNTKNGGKVAANGRQKPKPNTVKEPMRETAAEDNNRGKSKPTFNPRPPPQQQTKGGQKGGASNAGAKRPAAKSPTKSGPKIPNTSRPEPMRSPAKGKPSPQRSQRKPAFNPRPQTTSKTNDKERLTSVPKAPAEQRKGGSAAGAGSARPNERLKANTKSAQKSGQRQPPPPAPPSARKTTGASQRTSPQKQRPFYSRPPTQRQRQPKALNGGLKTPPKQRQNQDFEAQESQHRAAKQLLRPQRRVGSGQAVPVVSNGAAKCTHEGYVRDQRDCGKFYRCDNTGGTMRRHEFACPPGLHFDTGKGMCNWPALVSPKCGTGGGRGGAGGQRVNTNDNNVDMWAQESRSAPKAYADYNGKCWEALRVYCPAEEMDIMSPFPYYYNPYCTILFETKDWKMAANEDLGSVERRQQFVSTDKWHVFSLMNEEFVQNISSFIIYGETGNEVIVVTKDDVVFHMNVNNITQITELSELKAKGVIKIVAGESHVCALTSTGDVYNWGDNKYYQLGTGNTASSPLPLKMSFNLNNEKIVDIECGFRYTMALTDAGQVYAWGCNGHGQIGNGNTTNQSTPIKVMGSGVRVVDSGRYRDLDNYHVKSIVCGGYHSLAVTDTGSVFGWGYNGHGTGDKTTRSDSFKVNINHYGIIVDVVSHVNSNISAAVTANGVLYLWGECREPIGHFINPIDVMNFESIYDVFGMYDKSHATYRSIPMNIADDDHPVLTSMCNAFDNTISSNFRFVIDGQPIHVIKEYLIIRCKRMEPMMRLADTYAETDLKRKCTRLLRKGITIETVALIYEAAVKHSESALQEICFNYAVKHFEDSPKEVMTY